MRIVERFVTVGLEVELYGKSERLFLKQTSVQI